MEGESYIIICNIYIYNSNAIEIECISIIDHQQKNLKKTDFAKNNGFY